jgi:hypothetical protein
MGCSRQNGDPHVEREMELTRRKRLASGLDFMYSITFPLGIHSEMMRKYRGFFDTETPSSGKIFGWDKRFQIRTSRQSPWAKTKWLQCTPLSTATNLENLLEFILRPDPQVFDGHRTSSILPFAHVRKATAPIELADMSKF